MNNRENTRKSYKCQYINNVYIQKYKNLQN
jgi:hypothetical protein